MSGTKYMNGSGPVMSAGYRPRKGKREHVTRWVMQARQADQEIALGLVEYEQRKNGRVAPGLGVSRKDYAIAREIEDEVQSGFPRPLLVQGFQLGGIEAVRNITAHDPTDVAGLYLQLPDHTAAILGNGHIPSDKRTEAEGFPLSYLKDAVKAGGIQGIWTYMTLEPHILKHIYRLSGAEAPNVILDSKRNSDTLETAILRAVGKGNGNLRKMESGANE